MAAYQRRRRSDRDDLPPAWRRLPHHVLYPLVGFFLGLGSPVGAFLMRYWLADPILKALWVRSELDYNYMFYAYMGVGTVLSFMVFGYTIGRRSERQKLSNKTLESRVEELQVKSVTDSLTGTYTHGYLHEILEIEIQQALTNDAPLSVLILDVDDFKNINDTHGHLFGDRVLKETAEIIRANVRSEDIIGRYGGDEFLVIMPGADNDTAIVVARRVCEAVAEHGHLATVSIGAATFPTQVAGGPQELLTRADTNLYHAKHAGKNRVNAPSRGAHHHHHRPE